MVDPNLSDEELMNLIKVNNLEAFEQLYDRYFDKIYNYLKAKSNSEIAEDLAQNCFIKIYEKSSTYKNEYPVSAWVYTVAKNLLMDEFRKSSVKNKYYERIKELFIQSEANETKNLWNELMLDMKDLDEKNTEVLILRFKEGLEFEDIAKKLNTNPTNARKMVSRAIGALKNLLDVGNSL